MKVTMKMALASEDDLTVAYDLLGLLDNVERGYYPADESDEDAPTFLDVDDPEHLRLVYDRLKAIIDRRGSGAFHRVFGGFSAVRYEKNQILDLTKDVVELHPRLLAALEAAEKLTQIRKSIAEYYAKEGDESGSHAAIHSTETELVNGLIVLIAHMSDLAVSAGADAERALERARLAESRLESATQPLDEQMARLNQRVIELNAENAALRAVRPFQARVQPWMLGCFGAKIAADMSERCHRLFEESGEACQSKGMTRSEAHQLVDYTWDRPVGEPRQEVGGVMVTLAAFCLAAGIDMHEAGEAELARISDPETMAKIRAKQAAKPKHSPLPEAVQPTRRSLPDCEAD